MRFKKKTQLFILIGCFVYRKYEIVKKNFAAKIVMAFIIAINLANIENIGMRKFLLKV